MASGGHPGRRPPISDPPRGPEEFSIDTPRPEKDLDVSAADFGLNPEREDNYDALVRALQHCRQEQASRLTMPKGVYLFDSNHPAIALFGLSDFTLDGQDAEMVWRNPPGPRYGGMLVLAGCQRVHLKDFIDCPSGSFFISSASNVVLQNNVFEGANSRKLNPPERAMMYISYASGIHILNNRWVRSPYVPSPGAIVDTSNTRDIRREGNTITEG